MLDFSKMKKNAVKAPYTPGNGAGNSLIPAEPKNAVGTTADALKAKSAKTLPKREPEPTDDDYLLQIGIMQQENIKRGNLLTWEINKATRVGRPPEEIALLAAKAISLMTDDVLVYKYVAERFRKEYGIELEPKPPYKIITCQN